MIFLWGLVVVDSLWRHRCGYREAAVVGDPEWDPGSPDACCCPHPSLHPLFRLPSFLSLRLQKRACSPILGNPHNLWNRWPCPRFCVSDQNWRWNRRKMPEVKLIYPSFDAVQISELAIFLLFLYACTAYLVVRPSTLFDPSSPLNFLLNPDMGSFSLLIQSIINITDARILTQGNRWLVNTRDEHYFIAMAKNQSFNRLYSIFPTIDC